MEWLVDIRHGRYRLHGKPVDHISDLIRCRVYVNGEFDRRKKIVAANPDSVLIAELKDGIHRTGSCNCDPELTMTFAMPDTDGTLRHVPCRIEHGDVRLEFPA